MAKKKKKKTTKKRRAQIRKIIFLGILLIILGVIVFLIQRGYVSELIALKREAVQLVEGSDAHTFIPNQTSTIYDTDGNVILELNGEKDADYVAYEDIPEEFVQAMVSIEDKKFYSHSGVDFKALLRAVKVMFQKGTATQGGSTITMQLVKLVYMDASKTWQYKIQQMFLAWELEKKYEKNDIMEFYLNNIYFANGYYGIQAACTGYFDCELSELSLSQIAFLCAIPNSPTYYDPVVNIEHTLTRRNLILKNMKEDGVITEDEYESAVEEEIVLKRPYKESQETHDYVDTYIYYCATRALMKKEGFEFQYYFDSEKEEEEYNRAYDELYSQCYKNLYSGGYSIFTSIDMEKQELLQDAVDAELSDFTDTSEEGIYDMQGAAVSIDNNTGYVVAIVGGRTQNFTTYSLNRAYQSYRQPGSSFKPLVVYTPCFENGYTPASTVVDKKIEGGPSNSGGKYYGSVSVRFAVQQSLNTVAWQLFQKITPDVGLSYVKNMNFAKISDEDYTLSSALGGLTNGATPVEMAAAYATLEHDGLYREPSCIKSITDSDGNIIYVNDQREKEIYEQNAARMMTDVLQSVMKNGTGKSVKLSQMPCAGKTGTTNDSKDGWFVGYTRYYTTSVWVGCDMPKAVPGLSGSSYPGRIWNTYMEAIHEGLEVLDFEDYEEETSGHTSAPSSEKEEEEKEEKEDEGLDVTEQEEETPDPADTDEKETGETGGSGGDGNKGDAGDSGSQGSITEQEGGTGGGNSGSIEGNGDPSEDPPSNDNQGDDNNSQGNDSGEEQPGTSDEEPGEPSAGENPGEDPEEGQSVGGE